jgi:homogentisate 1,2-dioxygenase
MGLIRGVYDAKEGAFVPGGASIHNPFSAHGPDASTFNKAIKHDLQPVRYKHTLAFMFESSHVWQVTANALAADFRDVDYVACWQGLTDNFK